MVMKLVTMENVSLYFLRLIIAILWAIRGLLLIYGGQIMVKDWPHPNMSHMRLYPILVLDPWLMPIHCSVCFVEQKKKVNKQLKKLIFRRKNNLVQHKFFSFFSPRTTVRLQIMISTYCCNSIHSHIYTRFFLYYVLHTRKLLARHIWTEKCNKWNNYQ